MAPLPDRATSNVAPRDIRTRDLRSGGEWSRLQTVKNFFIAVTVRGAFIVADRLPARLLLALGRLAGHVAGRLLGDARRTAAARADACLSPDAASHVCRASFVRAGENLAISLLLRRPSTRALDWVDLPAVSRARFEQALGHGRGVVFVSAHLGPFELVPAAVAELGFSPTIVVRESYDPRLNAWVDAHRLARGIEVIHRGAARASLRIARALRAGRPVGLLPDLGGTVASLPVRFLGSTVAFPVGPQQLALRLGCPMVVGTLVRRQGQIPFALEIREIDSSGNLPELTQRVAAALESAILECPEEWLWMATRRLEQNRAIADGSAIPLDLLANHRS